MAVSHLILPRIRHYNLVGSVTINSGTVILNNYAIYVDYCNNYVVILVNDAVCIMLIRVCPSPVIDS